MHTLDVPDGKMNKFSDPVPDTFSCRTDRRTAMIALAIGALGMFSPVRGTAAESPGLRGYLRTNWSRDPFSFGSYSYVPRGVQQSDRHELKTSIGGRLFFAGEATHPRYNSTVHAAYESGIAAAGDVLNTKAKNVAIIGAGVSGLAAAHTIAGKGDVDVTLFEARDRIGGRVCTSHELGLPLDLGASWIHGSRGNPITALARNVQADMIPTDEDFIIRGKGGRRIKERDAPDWLENVISVQHDAGADSDQVNSQVYHEEPEYPGDDVIFPGGYETILSALSGDYHVRLSERVTDIAHSSAGVAVTSDSGMFRCDAAIVTLPLGVLKQGSVTFDPALPPGKQRAINLLGMGTLDKLYLRFDHAFWDRDNTWIATPDTGLPPGQFNQWLNLAKYLDDPLIIAFNGGPPALQLSGLPDQQLAEIAANTLRSAYP